MVLGYARCATHQPRLTLTTLQYLAIAIGGAAGAVCRFWVSSTVHVWLGRGFPWGTLAVNVIGSLLIGVLSVLMLERMDVSPQWRAGLLIGVLGSFTTFSTFSLETLNLFEQGETVRAMLNVLLSVLACVAAAWLGVVVARQL